MHLAIEDLLKDILGDRLRRESKLFKVKQIRKTLRNMRSLEILEWCGRLGLITPSQYTHLTELNRIRNTCAHNWVLEIPKYRRVTGTAGKKQWKRTPVVHFRNKNLLSEKVFFDDFLPVYSRIYPNFLARVWKRKGYF
jgi:hypothetical protein